MPAVFLRNSSGTLKKYAASARVSAEPSRSICPVPVRRSWRPESPLTTPNRENPEPGEPEEPAEPEEPEEPVTTRPPLATRAPRETRPPLTPPLPQATPNRENPEPEEPGEPAEPAEPVTTRPPP